MILYPEVIFLANMMDYILWRGDLTFSAAPWTPVDALILANIAYTDPGAPAQSREGALMRDIELPPPADAASARQWHALFTAAALSPRFGAIRLHDFVNVVDDEREIQFSAMTADLPDGRSCICFRGTDNTIVGWREDFTMSFESPVPAQTEALTYLERITLLTDRELLVAGHSKGGNLTVYAAAHASPQAQSRLQGVYSFDGPGMDDDTAGSEGYRRISHLVHSVIPHSSVVGLLMAYHPEYTVVRSTASGFQQHDAFTWQLEGPRFEEMGEVDRGSQLMDETVHDWLAHAGRSQRRIFVDTLFDMLESTGAQTLRDLKADKLRSALAILSAGRDIDQDTLKMIVHLVGSFLSIGVSNILDAVAQRSQQLLRDIRSDADHIGGTNHGNRTEQ